MRLFVTVIAGVMELAGVFMVGHALYRSGASGQEIYASSLQSGTGLIRSFDIDLDPSMSPVSFGFSAEVNQSYVDSSASMYGVNYWASLTLDRKQVIQRSVSFKVQPSQDSDGKTRTPQYLARDGLGEFEVPVAGRYRFAMAAQGGNDHRAIYNIKVEVRRNVEGPVMKKVWWGLGLILAGGLLQWLFGVPLPSRERD